MKADMEDADFVDKMGSMLDIEREEIEQILAELDSDSLIELTDAVSNGENERVEDIISKNETINPLLYKNKKTKHKKRPTTPPKDHVFVIGDDVAIRVKDKNGGHKFVSATIYQPDAPGNTIGVKIEGKPRMVDKQNVLTLKEMMMGMTGVPNLNRIMQLAGVSSSADFTPYTIDSNPVNTEIIDDVEEDECNPIDTAMNALDTLEHVLPNIKLSDLKVIRQKISELQMKMNESIIPQGRKRKI